MDLLNYINYHYVEEQPEWVKAIMGDKPKPLNYILCDLAIKITIIALIFILFYWGTRLLNQIWRSYYEKIREQRQINRRRQQRMHRPINVGGNTVGSSENPTENLQNTHVD